MTIELEHIGGEKHYKAPPLRKGEILASVSSLLSNNGLFNTHIARELDLYVSADRPEEDGKPVFPYADVAGRMEADVLPTSFGLRTTEHLIEALFNPVPSTSPESSPFTYYTPPSQAQAAVPVLKLSRESLDGRRSVDSSAGSASYSEHSGEQAGAAAGAHLTVNVPNGEQRHWWRRMRSRPSTPVSRTFKPPPTPMPVPIRQG